MRRHILSLGLSCAVVMSAEAQGTKLGGSPTRAQLEKAFSSLVAGDLATAKAAFDTTATSAPEGSLERGLASRLSTMSASFHPGDIPAGLDGAPLSAAFSLCLDGRPLEAQVAFLSAALSQPEGSPGRAFIKQLAQIAEAQEAGLSGSASAALTPITVTSNQPSEAATAESNASGTFTLIFTGAALGVGGGILADFDLKIGGSGAVSLGVPLVTGVAGALGGYGYTKLRHDGQYSFERAGTVAVGTILGAAEGLFISTIGNNPLIANGKGGDVIFATSLAGAVGGVAVSELSPGDRGDAFMVFSSALWATAFAAEGLGLVVPNNANTLSPTLTVGYNLGIAGGVAVAKLRPVSYRRLRIINGSGVLGTAAGGLLGGIIALAAKPADNQNSVRIVVGGATVGSIGGLTTGYLLTQKLAPPAAEKSAEAEPKAFQGLSLGVAQGNTQDEHPLTMNAHFTF